MKVYLENMIYLEKFNLLSDYQEDLVLRKEARRIFNSTYPLHLFPIKDLKHQLQKRN